MIPAIIIIFCLVWVIRILIIDNQKLKKENLELTKLNNELFKQRNYETEL